MVNHEVLVQGATPAGVAQPSPVLLRMDLEEFPARFLTALGAPASGAALTTLSASAYSPATLYQPVQRTLHIALLRLNCNTIGSPRLDPTRIESLGVVVRRVIRKQGIDQLDAPTSAWTTTPAGQCQWTALDRLREDQDPDPARRPGLQSGQPELDRLLALQTSLSAGKESFTPAFVAPPAVCEATGQTLVYAVLPTASSEVTTNAPSTPQYDPQTLAASLPTLLQAGAHSAILPGLSVDYRYMSDDYARANSATAFLTFSLTLRMLYSVFNAFDSSPLAQSLIAQLDGHNVHFLTIANNVQTWSSQPMGEFYRQAAAALIDYDPSQGGAAPTLTMPNQWDPFTDTDEARVLALLTQVLQARSSQVASPQGRYQDASRLYRARVFLRIKGHTPACPTQLVWSEPSGPFRIAAWHESAGRVLPPVPLPDPSDRSFLRNAKPNCSFSVPAGLMNAMQGASISGLSSGEKGSAGGSQLNWICGFNIPLITICAFFVLNIFLSLLNIVFFWLPFVKTCVPFPQPSPASSGDPDGT